MKATVRDKGSLTALRPLEVAGYLRATGWREERRLGDKGVLWLFRDAENREFEALLPLERSLRDFPARMAEVLLALEEVEQRSQLEILTDLQTVAADLIRLKVQGSDASDSTILLEDGVRIVENARDMMMSAACAALQPREVFPARKPTRAVDYMRHLRLGQTEGGSYVVTILSRVPPTLEAGLSPNHLEEPFERRVLTTLAGALGAIKSAVEGAVSSGGLGMFREAVAKGVSANLCDALAEILGGDEPTRDAQLRFSWSKSRPAQDMPPADIRFPADAGPILSEVARLFRETAPYEDFEVIGPVIRLDRPEGSPVGSVTVLGFVDNQPRRINIQLDQDAYALAIEAHRQEIPLRCEGELVKEGRSFVLRNPRRFVLASGDWLPAELPEISAEASGDSEESGTA